MDENTLPVTMPAPQEAFEPLPVAALDAARQFAAGVAAASPFGVEPQ